MQDADYSKGLRCTKIKKNANRSGHNGRTPSGAPPGPGRLSIDGCRGALQPSSWNCLQAFAPWRSPVLRSQRRSRAHAAQPARAAQVPWGMVLVIPVYAVAIFIRHVVIKRWLQGSGSIRAQQPSGARIAPQDRPPGAPDPPGNRGKSRFLCPLASWTPLLVIPPSRLLPHVSQTPESPG